MYSDIPKKKSIDNMKQIFSNPPDKNNVEDFIKMTSSIIESDNNTNVIKDIIKYTEREVWLFTFLNYNIVDIQEKDSDTLTYEPLYIPIDDALLTLNINILHFFNIITYIVKSGAYIIFLCDEKNLKQLEDKFKNLPKS